jgi:hypothetical protein
MASLTDKTTIGFYEYNTARVDRRGKEEIVFSIHDVANISATINISQDQPKFNKNRLLIAQIIMRGGIESSRVTTSSVNSILCRCFGHVISISWNLSEPDIILITREIAVKDVYDS